MSGSNWNLETGKRESEIFGKLNNMDLKGKTLDDLLNMLEDDEDCRDLYETSSAMSNPYDELIFGDGEDGEDEYILMSVTNLREQYNKRFITTAMIGFLNVVVDQFKWMDDKCEYDDEGKLVNEPEEVEPTAEERETVRKFLRTIFHYNPHKHMAPALDAIRADDDRRNGEIPPVPKEMVSQIPSKDLFRNFTRYIENYYEELRLVVKALYADEPSLEDAVCWVKTGNSVEELVEFAKTHSDQLTASFFPVKKREWCLRAPFRRNRENTIHYSKDCAIMSEIMERQHKDELLMKDMVKNRAVKSHRKNLRELSDEDRERMKDYKKFVGSFNPSGEVTEEDLKEYREKRKWLEDKAAELACPEDGIQIPVFEIDGKEVRKSVIYTKAEKHEETLDRLEQWASKGDKDAAKLKEVLDKGCRDEREITTPDGRKKKMQSRRKF